MKASKLIAGITFSILASSAFALPAINMQQPERSPVVAEGGSQNVGVNRVAADGAERVGANRVAADGADRVGANRLS